jgi:hypothetical protein
MRLRELALVASGLAVCCAHREAQTLERHPPPSTTREGPQGPALPAASTVPSGSPLLATAAASTQLRDASAPRNDEPRAVADLNEGAPQSRIDIRPRVCHVLSIGDSLTDPRSNGGGYLNAWRARCPQCRFTNIGRGGAMVNQMLSQLRRHLLETNDQYSHWVVFGGVNDLYSNVTAKRTNSKIERDLEAIYALGQKRGSLVISITVSPWGGFRRWYTDERGSNTIKLNNWIAQEQKAGKVDFVVDSGAVLSCGDPMLLCPNVMAPFRDGLHFGSEGHRRLGEALLSTLGSAACGAVATP